MESVIKIDPPDICAILVASPYDWPETVALLDLEVLYPVTYAEKAFSPTTLVKSTTAFVMGRLKLVSNAKIISLATVFLISSPCPIIYLPAAKNKPKKTNKFTISLKTTKMVRFIVWQGYKF